MKDIKYILKRVLIGVLIAIILTFINNIRANAATYQSQVLNADGIMFENSRTYEKSVNLFSNFGKGYVTFTYSYSPLYGNYQIFRVVNEIKMTTANGNQFICNIGGDNSYWNNQNQYIFGTAICSIDTTNTFINKLTFGGDHQTGYQGIQIRTSSIITFIQDDGSADIDRIINSIISATSTLANSTQIQTNYILDAIQNNNTQIINHQQQIIQQQQQTNDLINSDDITDAESKADDFINSINTTDNTGLSGIITAPLRMITNLTNTCQPISLTIPYMNKPLTIPCMSTSVYTKFSGLTTTIAIVINGFLIYRVIASLYYMIKGFKDPENDKVEVIDL